MSWLNRCIVLLCLFGFGGLSHAASPTQPVKRTKAEVDKIIDEVGKTQPEWWDKTPLKYPPSLDLTWTPTPGGGWQPMKNMGSYLWDHIDPNPGRWHEGIKLVQHTLTLNKGNPKAQEKAIKSLARIYTEMLEDYPRGAFWAKKSGDQEIILAECYLKLGCPDEAEEILFELGGDYTRNGQAIKLWADMGDLKTALSWAEEMAEDGYPTAAYLAAGDACRRTGKINEAIAYYEKVAAVPKAKERDLATNKKRAAASLEAIKLFELLDLNKIADGVYSAESIAYVGPLEVAVAVKNRRIESVKITKHKEKQFYASLTAVPAQIVKKQSVTGIDSTTGATVTSEAIINASAKALAGGRK